MLLKLWDFVWSCLIITVLKYWIVPDTLNHWVFVSFLLHFGSFWDGFLCCTLTWFLLLHFGTEISGQTPLWDGSYFDSLLLQKSAAKNQFETIFVVVLWFKNVLHFGSFRDGFFFHSLLLHSFDPLPNLTHYWCLALKPLKVVFSFWILHRKP